jgi:acyl-CoA thioester hydrolase
MESIGIKMPPPVHQTWCRVLYGDTDAAGVVYYANYYRYYEHGRTEFMRHHLISYNNLEKQGIILPVVESYSRNKASASYDQELLIETSLLEVKKTSCRFNYYIYKSTDNQLLVKGFTIHASISRKTGKLTKLPADLFAGMKKLTE